MSFSSFSHVYIIFNHYITSALETIVTNLNEIKSQNRWLLFLFKDLNKSKVDDCLNRLAIALEKFNVCSKFGVLSSRNL